MIESDNIRVSLWIEKNTYNQLCQIASKYNKTISKLMRDYINEGLGIKVASEDADRLTDIIKHQIENVCGQPIQQVKAMINKSIKSSEAGKLIAYSLLREFSNENTEEIIEKAELLSAEYSSSKVHNR